MASPPQSRGLLENGLHDCLRALHQRDPSKVASPHEALTNSSSPAERVTRGRGGDSAFRGLVLGRRPHRLVGVGA